MHRGIGKGVRPFLCIFRIVSQHQRPGAFGSTADINAAAAHFRKGGQGVPAGDPLFAFRRERDIDHRVAARRQVDTQIPHLTKQRLIILAVPFVREQRSQQFGLQKLVSGGKPFPEGCQVFPVTALFLDLPAHPVQCRLQFRGRHRLEQVFLHAQGYGFLGIGKIIIAGQDDPFHPGHGTLYFLAQFHSVHKRHADICQQDVRVQVPQHRQGHFTVRSFTDQLISFLLPWKGIAQVLPDGYLVIHEKDFHHGRFPPLYE